MPSGRGAVLYRSGHRGSLGQVRDMEMQNYYLQGYFGEKGLMKLGVWLGILVVMAVILTGII